MYIPFSVPVFADYILLAKYMCCFCACAVSGIHCAREGSELTLLNDYFQAALQKLHYLRLSLYWMDTFRLENQTGRMAKDGLISWQAGSAQHTQIQDPRKMKTHIKSIISLQVFSCCWVGWAGGRQRTGTAVRKHCEHMHMRNICTSQQNHFECSVKTRISV